MSGIRYEESECAQVADAIEQRVRQAEAGRFDLDIVLDAGITLPERLASPVTIEDLDRVIGASV